MNIKKYLNHHLVIECPKKDLPWPGHVGKLDAPTLIGFRLPFTISMQLILGPRRGPQKRMHWPHPPALVLQLTAGTATKISQGSRTLLLTRSLQCTSPLKSEISQFLTIPGCSKNLRSTVFICLFMFTLHSNHLLKPAKVAMSGMSTLSSLCLLCFLLLLLLLLLMLMLMLLVLVLDNVQSQFQTISYQHEDICWDSETSSPVACDLGSWLGNDFGKGISNPPCPKNT